ncbi:MAG: TlyA family RNA methyltransferase [Pseudomonadota bacterium]
MKRTRIRADQRLVALGLAPSRARAQALILAGQVFLEDKRIAKAGEQVAADAPLRLKAEDHPWVSRGGLKLDHALRHFRWPVAGAVVLDIGASTGGFTDVVLAHGAAKVYAVDVGHGQLAWRLRQDDRVIVLERTNARALTTKLIPEPIDLIVCDASFISLKTVLPAALALAKPEARLIALIKPQFEVGKAMVGKGGVVRDPALHAAVCRDIEAWLAARPGWHVVGVTPSPVTGPQGNREFLIAAEKRTGNAEAA